MKITFNAETGTITLADMGSHYNTIANTTPLRWNPRRKTMEGAASLDTLNCLAQITRLPDSLEQRRQTLQRVRDAVEEVREDAHPVAVIPPPVKANLFAHQIRAYDMALLTFGAVTPEQMEAAKKASHGET